MQRLLIKGKNKINGTINISGSKNASLPILAASILTKKLVLKNIPLVKDIFTMTDLLRFIGIKCQISKKKNLIKINNLKKNLNTVAPYKLVKTMRAGILVLGPLLAKFGKAKISLPGGCAIGSRPVDLHLMALKKLGARIKIKNGYIIAKSPGNLRGTNITFPKISVGATENAILAAFCAEGITTLNNCAIEPEVKDLIKFLNKIGGKIKFKNRKIIIVGTKKILNTSYKIMFDRIELGTYIIAAGICGKKIKFPNVDANLIKTEIKTLKKTGINISFDKNNLFVEGCEKLKKQNHIRVFQQIYKPK